MPTRVPGTNWAYHLACMKPTGPTSPTVLIQFTPIDLNWCSQWDIFTIFSWVLLNELRTRFLYTLLPVPWATVVFKSVKYWEPVYLWMNSRAEISRIVLEYVVCMLRLAYCLKGQPCTLLLQQKWYWLLVSKMQWCKLTWSGHWRNQVSHKKLTGVAYLSSVMPHSCCI